MTATVIAFPEPEPKGVESFSYDFALEDDAHAFLEGIREDLQGEAAVAYQDSEIWFSEEVGKWILRVDVVRLDVQVVSEADHSELGDVPVQYPKAA